jgi:pimeloyl-ACP methyl ester carboxylesterase
LVFHDGAILGSGVAPALQWRCNGEAQDALEGVSATRAREPDRSGFAENGGVRIAYEVFGDGSPTIVFLPNAPIIHSRQWKAQVPYFARHARVVTFDGRGNGRSDRPSTILDYAEDVMTRDAFAVMDASDTESAVVVALCTSVTKACLMAVWQPERVLGIVAIAPGIELTPDLEHWNAFESEPETDEGWGKATRSYWLRDWPGWARFWAEQTFPEPHSTRHIEETTVWQLETTAETELLEEDAPRVVDGIRDAEELLARVRCPQLIMCGDLDVCQGMSRAERMAELTGAPLIRFEGSGHVPPARHPVRVNLLIRDFVRSLALSEVPA